MCVRACGLMESKYPYTYTHTHTYLIGVLVMLFHHSYHLFLCMGVRRYARLEMMEQKHGGTPNTSIWRYVDTYHTVTLSPAHLNAHIRVQELTHIRTVTCIYGGKKSKYPEKLDENGKWFVLSIVNNICILNGVCKTDYEWSFVDDIFLFLL